MTDAIEADVAAQSWRESDDDYADVVVIFDDRTRLIRSSDLAPATQWVLQTRFRPAGQPDAWRGKQFFQDRAAMINLHLRWAADPRVRAIIERLPAKCPQRTRRSAL